MVHLGILPFEGRSSLPAVGVVGLALLVSGCLSSAPGPALGGDEGEPDPFAAAISLARATPHAVIADIDTGINPYHWTFRDTSTEALLHPSLYIPGYPADAVALNITLDSENYWGAVKADCDSVWSTLKPGTLYWFPGTKIVGAIYLSGPEGADCEPDHPDVPGIIGDGGHGTMTASRAASKDYGACKACKIVAIHGFSEDSVRWAGANAGWIDAQTNSWGTVTPLFWPDAVEGALATQGLSLLAGSPSLTRTVEEAAQEHLAFWASGNGAAFRWGALGHPTLLVPGHTPSVVIVGGMDSGYVNTWPGFTPHVISDSCNSWAAYHTNTTKSGPDVGGGTSGATPFAAGIAADLLLEARRILGDNRTGVHDGIVAEGTPATNITGGPLSDGSLTLEEWKDLVKRTATERPKGQYEDGTVCGAESAPYHSTPVKWSDVPEAYPEFVQIGYGAVDNESRALALAVLAGLSPMPDRGETEYWFALDANARTRLYGVWTGVPL